MTAEPLLTRSVRSVVWEGRPARGVPIPMDLSMLFFCVIWKSHDALLVNYGVKNPFSRSRSQELTKGREEVRR